MNAAVLRSRSFLTACLLLFVLGAGGCGILDRVFLENVDEGPLDLIEQGDTAMAEKEYSDAAKFYSDLKDKYPFSPYTLRAELGLADAYYFDGKYEEAEDAYKEFESLHPSDPQIPYVLFQIGMSAFNQFTSIDRPQTSTEEALQYFKRVGEEYPGTDYAQQAQENILEARLRIAEHELYVAEFYWNQERYGASWERFSYVADNFPDLPDIQAFAAKRSELAYVRFQMTRAEQQREMEQGTWKSWFDWL